MPRSKLAAAAIALLAAAALTACSPPIEENPTCSTWNHDMQQEERDAWVGAYGQGFTVDDVTEQCKTSVRDSSAQAVETLATKRAADEGEEEPETVAEEQAWAEGTPGIGAFDIEEVDGSTYRFAFDGFTVSTWNDVANSDPGKMRFRMEYTIDGRFENTTNPHRRLSRSFGAQIALAFPSTATICNTAFSAPPGVPALLEPRRMANHCLINLVPAGASQEELLAGGSGPFLGVQDGLRPAPGPVVTGDYQVPEEDYAAVANDIGSAVLVAYFDTGTREIKSVSPVVCQIPVGTVVIAGGDICTDAN